MYEIVIWVAPYQPCPKKTSTTAHSLMRRCVLEHDHPHGIVHIVPEWECDVRIGLARVIESGNRGGET